MKGVAMRSRMVLASPFRGMASQQQLQWLHCCATFSSSQHEETARASTSAAGKMWTFLEELENASCWKGIGCYSERNLGKLSNDPISSRSHPSVDTQDMSWTSSELTNGVGILALASILSWWCVCCDHNCANTFARQGNLWLFQLLSVRVNVEAINEGTWIMNTWCAQPIQAYLGLIASSRWLLLPPVAVKKKHHATPQNI